MNPALSSRGLPRVFPRASRYSPARSTPRYSLLASREPCPGSEPARAQRQSFRLSTSDQRACRASTSSAAAPLNNDPQSPFHVPDLQGFPDLSNHYSIFPKTIPFGPPPSGPFRLDLPSLRREFLQLQGLFHPDKYPAEKKAKAEALSARINEAYKVLQDPLLRAQYLLFHRYGVDVTSEDNSSHPADPGTLVEVMEAQESLEAAQTEDQIDPLKEQNQDRIEGTLRLLDEAFANDHADAAKTECIRLRYWVSLKEALNSWNGKGSDVRLVH
jgi:molecular chaperone HscB